MRKLSVLTPVILCLCLTVLSSGRATETVVRDAPSAESEQGVLEDGPRQRLDSLLMVPTPPYRFRAHIPAPAEPRPAAGLDSALAALAQMLTDSTHCESLPRLAVTPFEELNGSVSDTDAYMAEALEAFLTSSGRCRVVEREAVAQLLGVVAPTRAAVMDTTARRNLVRVFRLSGIVAGTVAHMDGGLKVMARVVNSRTGLITRTGEVWVRPEARPQNIPPGPPPRVPPTYPPPPPGVIRFEGEDMKILHVTGGTAGRQPSDQRWAGSWSGGAHLWWRNTKLGDRLELGFDVATTGTYEVKLQLTKANDYGIEQCYLDGRKLGEPLDLYNGRPTDGNSHGVTTTGPLDMGSHALKQGQHTLEFRIVGSNPKAVQSYMFGIDYLDLVGPASPGGGRRAGKRSVYPDTVVASIPTTDGHPQNLVCPRNTGRVYITGEYDDAVYVMRTSDNVIVDTLHIACGPTHIDCDADGRHVYVGSFDEYHPNAPDRLYSIRTSDNTVIDSVDLIDAPRGVACLPNGEYIYIALGNPTNKVAVIRTSDFSVVTNIPVGAEPCGIGALPNGQFVYVTCSYSGLVYVIRTSDNTVVRTIDAGASVHRLAVLPDGDYVYVSRYEYGAPVMVIRTSDNHVVDSIPVSAGRACGLTALPGGQYVYVTNRDANSVEIIRTSDNTVVKTVGVGSTPYGAASLPDGSGVYVANRGNSVSFIGYRR
ncbi:MAG TPA: hypothetical protein VMH22_09350 [bacterium]|nr:hypothetical protein [bacterium]